MLRIDSAGESAKSTESSRTLPKQIRPSFKERSDQDVLGVGGEDDSEDLYNFQERH